MKISVRGVVMLTLLLLATACGSVGDSIANQALEDQGITVDGDTVTVENADGSVTSATSGLPADFPADFPLPEGAQVQGGVSGAFGATDVVASLVLPGDVATNTAYFSQALPDAGYTVVSEISGPDRTNTVYEIDGGGVTGQVVLNPQGSDTLLGITLDLKQ
ncbi:MAG: hypothetical protein ACR2HR_04525 [Euzebya sp.]